MLDSSQWYFRIFNGPDKVFSMRERYAPKKKSTYLTVCVKINDFYLLFCENSITGCNLGKRDASKKIDLLNCFVLKSMLFIRFFREKPITGCDLGERSAPKKNRRT